MIVGHWELVRVEADYDTDFQLYSIFEFNSDGTLRFNSFGDVYEGYYHVDDETFRLYYGDNGICQLVGRIISMDENEMQWILDDYDHVKLLLRRTSGSVPNNGGDIANYIEATVYPLEGGIVRGCGYFNGYERCTLTAVANPGYVFSHWTEDGQVVTVDNPYSFIVYSDRYLVANFVQTFIPGEGARISVTGDSWFVLDHQYCDGETIHLENATFGLYGVADDARHQQLISGGEENIGERLRIGQAGLIWTDYSYVYFNMGDKVPIAEYEYEYGYGHAISLADGYILNNADIVFSPSSLFINGRCVATYPTRHLELSSNMCLFSNDASGWDVVQDQTATLGTVTIIGANGEVVAKYIPMLDESGIPCFYNSVSGRYIHHSGDGMPVFSRNANGH